MIRDEEVAIMEGNEALKFKAEATKHTFVDKVYGGRITVFRKPDGALLVGGLLGGILG